MSDAAETFLGLAPISDRHADEDHRTHDILGVNVWAATCTAAVAEIQRDIDDGGHRKLSFLNAHGANIAYSDQNYCNTLQQFTVLSDGVGLDLGARILYGSAFPENLNGTDFIPALLSRLTAGRKIALLGARPGIADLAAQRFSQQYSQHEFNVISDGYFDNAGEEAILAQLKQQRPDILLVAFGNPKQENWIAENCTSDHAAVCIGVGALLDFTSGTITRAPQWLIKSRGEWLYRLWLEPKRMWRRYMIGNPLFLSRMLMQKIFGPKNGPKNGAGT
ncbi:MAG: WecB/TagA/CpsF family glycosyltransferase [Rhizobiaceae bacterium]|nr:WecB/TagA/CpsF family glycosyltransferase [Rhizobiaceae bacterium]